MQYVMSVIAGLFLFASAHLADKPGHGTLVEASVKDSPKVIEARVGDLLQLTYTFAVVPGQMPATLKVEAGGAEVSKVTVVSVPNLAPNGKQLVGVGKLAAFLKADKPGTVTVKVTPEIENPTTYEVTVKVGER